MGMFDDLKNLLPPGLQDKLTSAGKVVDAAVEAKRLHDEAQKAGANGQVPAPAAPASAASAPAPAASEASAPAAAGAALAAGAGKVAEEVGAGAKKVFGGIEAFLGSAAAEVTEAMRLNKVCYDANNQESQSPACKAHVEKTEKTKAAASQR
ncbi:MAG: hypothetical protein V4735_01570 [Pseudomonadota bacterium]